ncbi:FecR family protein [Brevundimonas sp. SL130]|uniref:FecR family protein n=1 Tax=Brevundimonas sp. SL130 TaxID=2995143 RepID=UPI00226C8347|nr:FecR domain-containing protein [Brevundimonas sp. SL130]WAC61365.1 FecR domain-containing protein [Brevundimonas sp. SL130]
MSIESFDARDDRAAALWADEKQGGGWTPARQSDLDAWLAGRPDRQRLLDQHEALIADPAVLWAARRAAHRTVKPGLFASTPVWMKVWAPAGLAACVAGAALFGATSSLRGDLIVGRRGAPQAVALADGSAVRLNGASQVRVLLGDTERRLRLDGEGFFEVAHDAGRPFTVEAQGVRVTAVGTRFNVDSLETPDGPMVEVVVFEGAVDVTPSKGGVVRIRAGERARVLKGDVQRASLRQAEAETDFPSWAKGWLELDEATLISVIGDLKRATGVEVSLSDPQLGRALVSGRFSYENPENALAAIARLHGLRLTRKDAGQYLLSDA